MHIDQVLHGYNNGHHLIASSVTLPLKDADNMSYLSDWSGYVNPFNMDTSYITTYPLAESQSYVIAKSWYADEMSRPGCVWTHSLIVKIDKLGQKFNFFNLLKIFRRPKREGEDFWAYTKPIELDDDTQTVVGQPINGIDPTRFMFMSALLLDRQKHAVYMVEKEADLYTDLCMRLVQNMPYGILKDLSICSGSASIRKFENGFYNLQFVTGKGESLIEPFPENTGKPKADAGFQFWMDAVLSGRNDVSQMLHRFSGDIGNDSNKFLATLNLLKLLDDRIKGVEGTALFEELVNHIVNGFADKESGALIKRSFLSEQVCQYFCDEKTFILSLSTIKQCKALDYKTFGFRERVLSFKHTRGIGEYISLLAELSRADFLNEEGRCLLSNALEDMVYEEVVTLINRDWPLFKTIVTLNNQVLSGEFWLGLQPSQFVSLFAIFQNNIPEGFSAWGKLYDKLLTIDTFVNDNVCQEFVSNVGHYVSLALDRWNSEKTPINKSIMSHCMKQEKDVLQWMGMQSSINEAIRSFIKETIQPDDTTVVAMGSSVWNVFVKEELAVEKDANKLIFIYVLAFNWHDYNALSFIKGVLPYIYDALSMETLSHTSWMRIQKFTGEVPVWRFWDNCLKVLIGVKNYCKEMNLSSQEMENFTTHQKLNKELKEIWKKNLII